MGDEVVLDHLLPVDRRLRRDQFLGRLLCGRNVARDRRFPGCGRRRRDIAPRRALRRECRDDRPKTRSEEHTSELQSLMRISYDVFCLTNKKQSKQKYYQSTAKKQ